MNNGHDHGATCYFNTGTVNPITKASSTIKHTVAHNRRTAHWSRSNVNPSLSHLNYCLAGIESPSAIVAKVTAGMIEHKARKNAPHVVEALVSLPNNYVGDARAVFVDAIQYLIRMLGAENLLSADVHMDEPNPHMHVIFMPLEHCKKKGRLVWRSTINGRRNEIYNGFFNEVGVKHGLEKPIKINPKTRTALALAVIESMNRSGAGATKDAAWEAIKNAIKANPKPFAVLYGINVQTFICEVENSHGGFNNLEVAENSHGSSDGKSKTPSLCMSFESTALPIDLETGELMTKRFFPETVKSTSEPAPMLKGNRKDTARVFASEQDCGVVEIVRDRESENDPAYCNAETGEFMKPPQTTHLNHHN